MSNPDFEHIRLSTVGDVTLIEVMTKDIQGPKMAQELGTELAQVTVQEWAKRLLLDFQKVAYLSSTGFAVLFRVVTQANAKKQEVKFCGMDPAVELGADIVWVRAGAQEYYLDPAAIYFPFGILPWYETTTSGVRLGKGLGDFVKVPNSLSADATTVRCRRPAIFSSRAARLTAGPMQVKSSRLPPPILPYNIFPTCSATPKRKRSMVSPIG